MQGLGLAELPGVFQSVLQNVLIMVWAHAFCS